MVAVFATVQDPAGQLVPDLVREDFEVLDDSKPVELALFSNEPQPITAVAMLDLSGSVFSELPRIRASLHHFISALQPRDRLRIGSFGKEVALSHALTGDAAVLRRVVQEELWPGGASPLWRALMESVNSLQGEPGRRVVLVLTDGVNYATGGRDLPDIPGGFTAVKQVAVADAGLMFYAVGYGDPKRGRRLRGNIVELTDITGGGHVDVPDSADLGEAFERIGHELRHQYLLGFVSANSIKPRSIKIRVKRSDLKVRSRASYLPGGTP